MRPWCRSGVAIAAAVVSPIGAASCSANGSTAPTPAPAVVSTTTNPDHAPTSASIWWLLNPLPVCPPWGVELGPRSLPELLDPVSPSGNCDRPTDRAGGR